MAKPSLFSALCLILMIGMKKTDCRAQVPITVVNTAVVQSFDALLNTGTGTQSGGIFAEGWSFLEGGSNADESYQAGTGSSNTGDTYSFGLAGVNNFTDRALGLLQSGSLTSTIGFKFSNNTNQTVSSLTVSYTGEVWRLNAGVDGLAFSYQIGDVALNAATGWTAVPALDFFTPVSGTAAAVDGNMAANRATIGAVTIAGLYIRPGDVVTFRWIDATSSSSAAMALDDFSITLIPASTGYFRSRSSGNWNAVGTWETSIDNANWVAATNAVPTDFAAAINVLSGHTVTVSADLAVSKLTVQAGGKMVHSSGSLTVSNFPGNDLVLKGPNAVFEIAGTAIPALNSGALFRIDSGAVLLLSGNSNLLNFQSPSYSYASGGIFEYASNLGPNVTGTFFSLQDAGATPVFRYSSGNATSLGSAGSTVINGKIEVVSGKLLNLSGVSGQLIIRNGITGSGDMKAATTVLMTGPLAELSGAGTINASLSVEASCTTMLSSNKMVSNNNTLTINGTLDFSTWQLQTQSGSGSFVLAATGLAKTANANGLVYASGSLRAGNFSVTFSAGSTVEYGASTNQAVSTSAVPAYQNLLITGSGIKTAQGGANLIVQGNCNIQAGATLALTGAATENLYLNNNASLRILNGGVFDNGGESSVTHLGGTPAIFIDGRFITRDQQGFMGTNTAVPSISPVLNTNCTIEYARLGDQVVQGNITYENLQFSGSGIKTPSSALALMGTVTIAGAAVLDASSSSVGGPTNDLVMTGSSRFIVGGTGTRPANGGAYSLGAGTTVEFVNSNLTTCTIRQGGAPVIQYANIEITGNNVSAPLSGISLQAGATLTIRNGGALKITSVNGLYGSVNAAILSGNNPVVVLENGSMVDYSGSNQAITPGFVYSQIKLSGSGAKTASGPFSVAQLLVRSGTAGLAGNSPAFLSNALLAYADAGVGRTYTTGLEWPSVNGPSGITVNLTGGGNAAVLLSADKTIVGPVDLLAGSLDLNGRTLSVTGNITGSGTFIGSSSSSLLLNGGNSQLSFSQQTDESSNALNKLTLIAGAATLAGKLNLYNLLNVSGGSLNLNNESLVLKSIAAQTAAVAEIKGVLMGATNVTAERYIPVWGSRRYRLVTAPVWNATVNGAWQEGSVWNGLSVLSSTGYGTLITGQQQGTALVANGNGFDFWSAISNSSGSVRRYLGASDPSQGIWDPLSTTLSAGAFNNQEAYLLFVRGDRSVSTGTTPFATTLHPKGGLKQGVFSATVALNKTHTVVGNPYPSPLDFKTFYDDNPGKIQSSFVIWQSSLGTGTGGYVVMTPDGTNPSLYEPIPGDGSKTAANRLVHSGEGFLVMPLNFDANNASTVTLGFKESHKSTTTPGVAVFRQLGTGPAKLYLNVYTMSGGAPVLADGVLSQYSGGGGGTAVQKLPNTGENLAIVQGGRQWIVASSALPREGDTLQLRLWNTGAKDYRLELRSAAFAEAAPGLQAVLRDRYLGKETPLSLRDEVVSYPFSLGGEAGSGDPLRFSVVFHRSAQAPLPVVVQRFTAQRSAGGVEAGWQMAGESGGEQYTLERSPEAVSGFMALTTVAARGGGGEQAYGFLDEAPLSVGYYRLRISGAGVGERYSGVVRVEWPLGSPRVVVYPNPVRGGVVQLQLENEPAGNYRVVLYTTEGRRVQQTSLEHSGGVRARYRVVVDKGLASGHYHLQLTHTPNGKKQTLPLSILN